MLFCAIMVVMKSQFLFLYILIKRFSPYLLLSLCYTLYWLFWLESDLFSSLNTKESIYLSCFFSWMMLSIRIQMYFIFFLIYEPYLALIWDIFLSNILGGLGLVRFRYTQSGLWYVILVSWFFYFFFLLRKCPMLLPWSECIFNIRN